MQFIFYFFSHSLDSLDGEKSCFIAHILNIYWKQSNIVRICLYNIILYASWKKAMDRLPTGIAILKCDMAIYHNQKAVELLNIPDNTEADKLSEVFNLLLLTTTHDI